MVKILIGSRNVSKIDAVKDVFSENEVQALEVNSQVSVQPFSDEETKQGAINRAMQCKKAEPDALTIGLEGGVMYIENELHLINWGAMVTPDWKKITASGARIPLPQEIDNALKTGKELAEIMEIYTNKADIRSKKGTIGVFTKDFVSRGEMFAHVIKLLRGQWEFRRL